MARMDGIVGIDASEDGEYVRLYKSDKCLYGIKRDYQHERQRAADPTNDTKTGTEQDDKARENLKRDVSCQHICEQTHAMRKRPRDEGQYLDPHHERQKKNRHALGHEQIEEMKTMPHQAVNHHHKKHCEGEGSGDDDLACNAEGMGDQANHVQFQNEHE